MTTLHLQFNDSMDNAMDDRMTEVSVNGEPWIEFVDDFDWQNDFNIAIIRAWLDHQANYLFEDTDDLKSLLNLAVSMKTPQNLYQGSLIISTNLIQYPGKWRIVIED